MKYRARIWLSPFRQSLSEQGWVEGKSVTFENRRADGDLSRLSRHEQIE